MTYINMLMGDILTCLFLVGLSIFNCFILKVKTKKKICIFIICYSLTSRKLNDRAYKLQIPRLFAEPVEIGTTCPIAPTVLSWPCIFELPFTSIPKNIGNKFDFHVACKNDFEHVITKKDAKY